MNDGKAFESHVARLLQASGYTVRPEELLGTKRVDVVAETIRFGRRQIYAVECKDHGRPLSREDVAKIIAGHSDLFDRGWIDGLLMVTRNGLTPTAAAFVRENRRCSHQTLAEMERSVIDFSSYLTHLVSSYEEDNLSGYYVPSRTNEGLDLAQTVLEWMDSDATAPLAILGSYGMGKTTFTRHVAASLAAKALDNPAARIPILLPLGMISSEQSLSGLLGRQFTATHNVRQYSYAAFDTMNRLGKFVIFLDGFDEMKHTLDWHEFRYNFQQLLQLIVARSKVVVLGRPTAFISDEEHLYILHGRYKRNGEDYVVPDWPDFREVELAPFDNKQIATFLRQYFQTRSDPTRLGKNLTAHEHPNDRAGRLLSEFSSKRMRDLAQRPVQLKMLAEILPDWRGDFSKLTVATLYDHFIDRMIERELSKAARHRFKLNERRRFARELAWWLWTDRSRSGLRPDDIPDQLIDSFVAPNEDRQAVRRDLTSACFLERKLGGALYFPHRSFQEFLVAEKVHQLVEAHNSDLRVLSGAVTGEVGQFLSGISSAALLLRWLDWVTSYRGEATVQLFSVLAENQAVAQAVVDATTGASTAGDLTLATKRANPWHALLRVLISREHTTTTPLLHAAIDYFLAGITEHANFNYAMLNLFCAFAMSGAREERKEKKQAALYRVIQVTRARLQGLLAAPAGAETSEEDLSQADADEDDQDSHEVRTGHRTRPRPRLPIQRSRRKRLRDLASQTGLLEDNAAVNVALLMERVATSLQGYAMFVEWGRAGANLASEFGLPRVVTLPCPAGEAAREDEHEKDIETDSAEVGRARTVKRNFRGRFR
jgi:hypothetical protein